MNENVFSSDLFAKVPIVGIVRGLSDQQMNEILPLYIDAGLTTIEITMNTPRAAEMIRSARSLYTGTLNIGAGTVCTMQDLEDALNAGAQFIVTPIINAEVIKACADKAIPIFPGAYTPTEIYHAWSLGAAMVKVYPATSLGPDYIKDVKAPLNQIKLMPTGGVNLENLNEFRKAGADGFGIGSQLFDKAMIKDKNWTALKAHFEAFVQKLQVD